MMSERSCCTILALFVALASTMWMTTPGRAAETRDAKSFNRNWKFHLGDVKEGEKVQRDVSSWRSLDLPHDWSIEGPIGKDPAAMDGPFDRNCPGGDGTGYLNGGIAWYRKTFTLPPSARTRHVFLQFDGVYMDSDVWLNGHHLGNHPYGYTSFQYDLTPYLTFDAPGNVLAVRVKVIQPCSRWYSGAGIYRNVWLTLTAPVHVAPWGTYITTPEVTDAKAQVRVRTRVRNDGKEAVNVTLKTVIVAPDDKRAAQGQSTHEIAPGGEQEFDQTLPVENVRRWSLQEPSLYTVLTEVSVGNQPCDAVTTPFGIRTIHFTVDKGFFLNDKHVPIQGVCNHHDLGCLGTAVYRRGIERQLEILKAMGCNAIRTSHNPPAPELLELCDRMGFLVMDEAFDEWKSNKTSHGYGRFFDAWSERDLVSMLHRDRNHPCIILWSIGNEINEQGAKNGYEMSKRLADICHREDPTRPVTSACNNPWAALQTGYAKPLDVLGINYNIGSYRDKSGKNLVASETASALSTRGAYNLVLRNGKVEIRRRLNHQCTSYDLDRPDWGHTAETSLEALKDSPWVAGEFVWTGFDYIGEPTPYRWPSRSSYFGIIDLAGFPKDRFYLYQSRWTDKPMVHLLPHWNWPGFEGKAIPVWAFTNAESVELFLNDKSLGIQEGNKAKNLHLEWKVPYQPGTLRAVARTGGKEVAVDTVLTAGKPARLVLKPDRKQIQAGGQDLSFVEVRIVDAEGHLCPLADHKVTFSVRGPGRIAGVDNGDPTNHEPFQAQAHKAFHGLALVVIQSTDREGDISLSASAPELAGDTTAIGVSRSKSTDYLWDALDFRPSQDSLKEKKP